MVNCPVCGKEHKTMVNMSTHMIMIGVHSVINRIGDNHERYLNLLTGKDIHVWGHKNDAKVAELMSKYYRRKKRLPTLEEMEEANDYDSRMDI